MQIRERSGRVLDSRPRGRRYEPHRRHCIVSLKKDMQIKIALEIDNFIVLRFAVYISA